MKFILSLSAVQIYDKYRTWGCPLFGFLSLDQPGTKPTKDLVPTGIALGVIETHKLHHHSKLTSPGRTTYEWQCYRYCLGAIITEYLGWETSHV